MYRKFILSIFLLVFMWNLLPVCAQRTVVTRSPYYNHRYVRPYYNSYRRNYYSHRGNYSENFTDTSAPEGYTLREKNIEDSKLERLQRLERQIFGAVQQGDFDERFQKVREANAIRQQKQVQKTVMRKIGDYFAGQLTGFEPPLSDDFSYGSNYPTLDYTQGYGNSSLYTYGTNPLHKRYRVNNYGVGNSGGIRILDWFC